MKLLEMYIAALTRWGEHVGRSYFLCSETLRRGRWWIGEVRVVDGRYIWVEHKPRVRRLRQLIPLHTNRTLEVVLSDPVPYEQSLRLGEALASLPRYDEPSPGGPVPDWLPPLN